MFLFNFVFLTYVVSVCLSFILCMNGSSCYSAEEVYSPLGMWIWRVDSDCPSTTGEGRPLEGLSPPFYGEPFFRPFREKLV